MLPLLAIGYVLTWFTGTSGAITLCIFGVLIRLLKPRTGRRF